MIDINLKYQIAIFLDIEDIKPKPDSIISFTELFKEQELIPTTTYEIRKGIIPRMSFNNPNEGLIVNLLSDRIAVEKNPIDIQGSNLKDMNAFCNQASWVLGKVLEKLRRKAKRLALNTICLLNEMEQKRLNSIYCKLFGEIPFYKANPPYEWNWRSVSSLLTSMSDQQENINVISMMERVSGEISFALPPTNNTQTLQFDRIQMASDINTSQDNKEARFEMPQIKAFLEEAKKQKSILTSQMLEFINE